MVCAWPSISVRLSGSVVRFSSAISSSRLGSPRNTPWVLPDGLGAREDTWHSDVHTAEFPKEPSESGPANLQALAAAADTGSEDATVADPLPLEHSAPAPDRPALTPLLAVLAGIIPVLLGWPYR